MEETRVQKKKKKHHGTKKKQNNYNTGTPGRCSASNDTHVTRRGRSAGADAWHDVGTDPHGWAAVLCAFTAPTSPIPSIGHRSTAALQLHSGCH